METIVTRPIYVAAEAMRAVGQAIAQRWSRGWRCSSDARFALIVSTVWLVFYNTRFWSETIHAMWRGSIGSAAFLASLFVLAASLQGVLLLLLPSPRAMRAASSVMFIVGAIGAYFVTTYGVVLNQDMLRNVFETDATEALSLLSRDFFAHFAVLGVVPAAIVWRIELPVMSWPARVRRHAADLFGALTIAALAVLSCSASYAVFFREHKLIRFTLLPAAPLTSALGLMTHHSHQRGPLINASGESSRTGMQHVKPRVVVMVVGETARAANFELGGYTRHTNPELAAIDGLVYFPETTSCGTATAVSVPCMFSHLPRRQFDVDDAPRYANALDALSQAGVAVEWRDNNAGCKGVCARVQQVAYGAGTSSPWCRGSYCYDAVLLTDLPAKLRQVDRDTLIVLHQIGSHGPAYAERYPPEHARFTPACASNELQQCTPDEVRNAYDNTIAYTDHVLAQAIGMLRQSSDRVDAMLLYVSDHGESLGEQGVYLHGLPYAFAPEAQKHVPMLMWLAPSFAAHAGVSPDCMGRQAGRPHSHDNVYHTLLSAFDVRNASYDTALDMFAECRDGRLLRDHE